MDEAHWFACQLVSKRLRIRRTTHKDAHRKETRGGFRCSAEEWFFPADSSLSRFELPFSLPLSLSLSRLPKPVAQASLCNDLGNQQQECISTGCTWNGRCEEPAACKVSEQRINYNGRGTGLIVMRKPMAIPDHASLCTQNPDCTAIYRFVGGTHPRGHCAPV